MLGPMGFSQGVLKLDSPIKYQVSFSLQTRGPPESPWGKRRHESRGPTWRWMGIVQKVWGEHSGGVKVSWLDGNMSKLLSELHGQLERSRHRGSTANLLDQNLKGEALELISHVQEETGSGCGFSSLPTPCERRYPLMSWRMAVAGLEAANYLLSLALHPNHHFCCSVTKSCTTLCELHRLQPARLPDLHYLLELTQTHVFWVGDAFQPSQAQSYPSPPVLNLSHCQGLF